MRKLNLLGLCFAFILSGCVVRTYQATKDRVDQNLAGGNRGYLQGNAPADSGKERVTTRTTQVVEIELHPPIKFEKSTKIKKETAPVQEPMMEEMPQGGNRGYISGGPEEPVETAMQQYKVKRGDTLQKISKQFYGTTKKWMKIYEANKHILKGPNRIIPGQTINIPVIEGASGLMEPKENLK